MKSFWQWVCVFKAGSLSLKPQYPNQTNDILRYLAPKTILPHEPSKQQFVFTRLIILSMTNTLNSYLASADHRAAAGMSCLPLTIAGDTAKHLVDLVACFQQGFCFSDVEIRISLFHCLKSLFAVWTSDRNLYPDHQRELEHFASVLLNLSSFC